MIYDVMHQNLNLRHYMNDRLLDSAVDPDSTCVFNFSNKVQKRVCVTSKVSERGTKLTFS